MNYNRLNATSSKERKTFRDIGSVIVGIKRSSLSEKNMSMRDEIFKKREIEAINKKYNEANRNIEKKKTRLNTEMIFGVINSNGGVGLYLENNYIYNKCEKEISKIKEDKSNQYNRAIADLDNLISENEKARLSEIQKIENRSHVSYLDWRRTLLKLDRNGVRQSYI